MDESLDATLAAAVEGDESAWRRLVGAYSRRVYGLVVRQCGDGELAEEITQATFVQLVKKLGEYQERGRFESWLFRIALNRLRDEMRRRKRQARATDFVETPLEGIGYVGESAGPDEALVKSEQAAALHRAIAELPEQDRELLALRYTAQLSYPQIAEALNEPLGTVLARGHRALKKLKAMMIHDE